MKGLIYDTEILKAIPTWSAPNVPGIEYCQGWRDFPNMGLACCCALEFDSWGFGAPRVFLKDNFDELARLAADPDVLMVGFNNHQFDDQLLQAAIGARVANSYDLLREVWMFVGVDPDHYHASTHGGYGLNAIAEANDCGSKTGRGDLAPILWQKGQPGKVIDYCMNDVFLLARLIQKLIRAGSIINPVTRQLMYPSTVALKRVCLGL